MWLSSGRGGSLSSLLCLVDLRGPLGWENVLCWPLWDCAHVAPKCSWFTARIQEHCLLFVLWNWRYALLVP